MELVKLLLLIICSALLLFVVLPAIVVFFVFRTKDACEWARRAKTGVIIGIVVGALLLGVIVWEAVDLFLPEKPTEVPDAPTAASTEAPTQPTEPSQATEATEDPVPIGATISTEQLDGLWIAASVPYIPEDENYTHAANGGYYHFEPNGNFTFTQVLLVKNNIWAAQKGEVSYTGTYVLEGDTLTLHYTSRTSQVYDPQTDTLQIDESVIDETDRVSMLINQSCTEMCVMAPDHPKLGELCFFRKGRGSDPIAAILILINSEA